jgi:hypothetical protein
MYSISGSWLVGLDFFEIRPDNGLDLIQHQLDDPLVLQTWIHGRYQNHQVDQEQVVEGGA